MSEKLRFLIVGAYNTAFGYATFVLLYLWLHDRCHYLIIALLAHAVAVTNAFLLHRKIVFRAQDAIIPAFLRFNLSTAVALLFSLGAMALLVELFAMFPLVAQAFVTGAAVVVSYFLHRHYTFPVRRRSN